MCVCECARGWLRFPLHMCACVSCRINDTARFVSSDFAKMEREEGRMEDRRNASNLTNNNSDRENFSLCVAPIYELVSDRVLRHFISA